MSFHPRASVYTGILVLCAGARLAQAQVVPATRAHAQSEAPATPHRDADAATAAARSAHLRGLQAREAGDWTAARDAFAEAWAQKRHWEIAVNLGEAEMRVGEYEEAIVHLTFALEERGFLDRSSDLVMEEKKLVNGWLDEARRKLEGERARAAAPPPPSPPPAPAASPDSRAWLLGVGGGVGLTAAGVVTSVVLLADAGAKVDTVRASVESLPGEAGDPGSVRCQGAGAAVCRANVERLRAADAMQAGGTVALASAGVIAAATVVYAVLGYRRTRGAPLVAPAAGDRALGVALLGVW